LTAFNINRKIRAQKGAQTAISTLGVVGDFRGMIAFGVGAGRHNQDATGAEFDTETASFAAFLDDVNNTAGYPIVAPVERGSPVFHSSLLTGIGLKSEPVPMHTKNLKAAGEYWFD